MHNKLLLTWIGLLSFALMACAAEDNNTLSSEADAGISTSANDTSLPEARGDNEGDSANTEADSEAQEPNGDGVSGNDTTAELSDTLEPILDSESESDVPGPEEDGGAEDDDSTEEEDSQACESVPGCTQGGALGCNETGDAVLTCTEVSLNCYQWAAPIACEGNEVCVEGVCTLTCEPICPSKWCGEDGCGGLCGSCLGGDELCFENWCVIDGDSDGSPQSLDCMDGNPSVFPGGIEVPYDGLDNDCDVTTSDDDVDGDGAICECMGGDDCDDSKAAYGPEVSDTLGDEIDFNCDGHDGVDSDGDFHASLASGGGDCNDKDENIFPGANDVAGDGEDTNCDGVDGYAPPPLPDGLLCTLFGAVDAVLECALKVARFQSTGPLPIGLQSKFSFHASKVKLLNLSVESCPPESEICAKSSLQSGATLQTGHALHLAPTGSSEDPIAGTLALMLLHPSSLSSPLSNAVQDESFFIDGEPTIVYFRFQLLQDIAPETPVKVVMQNTEGVSETLQTINAIVDDGLVVVYD